MMCSTIHLSFSTLTLASSLVHDLFFWTWGFVILPIRLCHAVQHRLLNHVHCTHIWKVLFFVLLGKYASVSLIFFRCWLLHRCHFFFCIFCHFQLLCSTIRCLQFCPIKSPHHEKNFFSFHEMPRKSLRVMHYCKFLHMRIARARGEFFEWFCKRISKVILSFTLASYMQLCIFAPKWHDMITSSPLLQCIKITRNGLIKKWYLSCTKLFILCAKYSKYF